MRLLVVRHAIALEREDWAKVSSDDRERPISEKGASRMKKSSAGLKKLLGDEFPEKLITSPLLRAKQTAAILLNDFAQSELLETETLAPEHDVEDFAEYLKTFALASSFIACVGHEPHLNHLVAWLVCKSRYGIGEMKKGGACLLEFEDEVVPGKACLRWLLTASQLRDLE